MKRTRLLFACAAALLVWPLVAPVGAHQLPLEVVVYLKAEGAMLRVLARVPAAFLADARLPVRSDGYLDLQAIDGPLSAVAAYVSRSLDVGRVVMDAAQTLPAPAAAWRVTRPSDAAFDRYDSAAALFEGAQRAADIANIPIDPDTALIDLRFDYPLPPGVLPAARVSIRVNEFRAGNRLFQMRVLSMLDSGNPRVLVTTGAPRRVTLNPGWREVLPIFSRLGLEQLMLASELLLFMLCLAIPRRPMRSALTLFGALAAGYLLALVMPAFGSGSAEPSRVLAPHALAAAILVVAALQNITSPRPFWALATAAVFGAIEGLNLGAVYSSALALAGSHTLVSLAVFAAPVLLGSLWLLLVAKTVVGFVFRFVPGPPGPGLREGWTAVPKEPALLARERWAIILLSAVVIHAGLHGLGLL